jgi:serine/threonine protein phosphatase PrpC
MITQMDCYGQTDVGRARASNQDHFLVADLSKSMRVHVTSLNIDDETRVYGGSQGKLLVVADGMGGEAEGERASTIAVDQITTYVLNSLGWCFRLEEHSEHDFEESLKEALESCQKSIQHVVAEHPEMKSMGTTMTMAYVIWPRAFIVHVGDSRCYISRGGQLEQITRDHTMGALLAQSNQLSREESRQAPMRHVLWNVLGGRSDELSVDTYKLALEPGDTLLLATDGLYEMIPDEQLQNVIASEPNAESACRTLIRLANANGGKDNITAVVARFLSPQREEPRAFVEMEVPLDVITAPQPNFDQTTVELPKI